MSTDDVPAQPAPAAEEDAVDTTNEPVAPQSIPVKIKLPSGSEWKVSCFVEETVAELKMNLWESDEMCYVAAYELCVDGGVLDDYSTLNDCPLVQPDCTIEVRRTPYCMRTLCLHIGRLLNLQERPDPDCALPGILDSLEELESVVRPAKQKNEQQQQQQQQQQQGGKVSANKKKKAKKKKKKAAAAASNSSRARSGAAALAEAFSVAACTNVDVCQIYPSLDKLESDALVAIRVAPSRWGQPSASRAAQGDLAYLCVETCDGQAYEVTGSTTGFFLNKSTKSKFNPNAASKTFPELPPLISSVNSAFEKAFEEVLHKRAAMGQLGPYLFDRVSATHGKQSWLAPFRQQPQVGEPGALLYLGDEVAYGPHGMSQPLRPPTDVARDWNAEVQSFRDMQNTSMMDAVARDRGLHSVQTEFIDAATEGALKIVNKDLLPANPQDTPSLHLFVHNNIFYTYANGDKYEDEDGVLAEDGDDQFAYKLSNNDILGTSIYNHAAVDGLHTVMTALITLKGVRVFAQAIVPGILQANPAPVVYGSLTHGQELAWDEEVHGLMEQAAQCLFLATQKYEAGDSTSHPMAASVTTKCIRATDGRVYAMDLDCPSCPDPAWGKRWAIYRPELLRRYVDYCQRAHIMAARQKVAEKRAEQAAAKEAAAKAAAEKGEAEAENKEEKEEAKNKEASASGAEEGEKTEEKASAEEDELEVDIPAFVVPTFNPNYGAVRLKGKIAESDETMEALKAEHDKLATYLQNIAVPSAANDILSSELPIDSEKMRFLLQARGVNLRYMGDLAAVLPPVATFHRVLVLKEMLVRTAKHLFNALIGEVPTHQQAAATAHFATCLVQGVGGLIFATLKKAKPVENVHTLEMEKLTKTSLHRQLIALAAAYYKTEEAIFEQLYKEGEEHRISLLRSFCLKTGIRLRPRAFDFSRPIAPNDIAGIYPLVKTSLPAASTALRCMDAADNFMAQGDLNSAYDLYSEALSCCHHTTGPLHYSAAMCFLKLADVLSRAGDVAKAINHMQYGIIILERVRGLDRHDIAVAYLTLAQYLETAKKPLHALFMYKRALFVFLVLGGGRHVSIGSLHLKLGRLLQEVEAHQVAVEHLERALEIIENVFGPEHPKTGDVCHALAQACSYLQQNKRALDLERRNYEILTNVRGEAHELTKQSGIWLKQFTLKAVQEARVARESTTAQLASGSGIALGDGDETPLFSRPIDDILKYVNSGDAPKQTRRARHPFPSGRRVAKAGAMFPSKP